MHLRRSSLSFLFVVVFLLSTSLLFLYRSTLISYIPWNPIVEDQTKVVNASDGTGHDQVDHGHDWPDPVPGDDTLRKKPSNPDIEADAGFPGAPTVKSPLLQARLHALLNAPVLSYAEATPANEAACPPSVADKQVNQDQLKGNREEWITISKEEIKERRKSIVRFLEVLESQGTAVMGPGLGSGRGIVMTAGNKDTAHNALVTLRLLREEYKCTLPVEIFSFPGEIQSQELIRDFRKLDAIHYELPGLQHAPGAWKSFHLKAASIVTSSFSEVLYLDSDNLPLRNPEYLFDSKAYKEGGGAVFWPDYNKDHPDNAIWRVLGKTCYYTEWEVESGQILIDKRGNDGLNLAALHVASHMQANYDFWFRLSGGDKDTFRYAFWALDAKYYTAPRWLSPLGTIDGSEESWQEGKFCGLVMLQYDIEKNEYGEYPPLFVHANLLKHRLKGWENRVDKLFKTIKRPSENSVQEPSLDRVTAWVYNAAGMCVDIKVDPAVDNRIGAGMEQRIVTEPFDQVYNGAFKDFERNWKKAGGRAGGF
ncbi:glycosyltransferase family 71 protein [Sphaerobolus stellatus SS14]|nr:glycosyltransferase family 71 protein [Sphaerobolus stellatus SS14]